MQDEEASDFLFTLVPIICSSPNMVSPKNVDISNYLSVSTFWGIQPFGVVYPACITSSHIIPTRSHDQLYVIYPLLVPPRKTHPNCNQKNTYPSTSLVFTQTTPPLLAILQHNVQEYKRGMHCGIFLAFKYPTPSRALNIPLTTWVFTM